MADEQSCPRTKDIDRLESDLRELRLEVRADYVRKDVYQAALDRIASLESRISTTWLSNRNALFAVASVIAGIVVSAYIAKGH